MTTTTRQTLDRRGKTITTFVVYDAARALADIEVGQTLTILTDDFPAFPSDIAAWCRMAGHRLVDSERTSEGLRFTIEKGSPPGTSRSLAMVISTAGLEELLSPLAFALGAALEGMEVHLYFQGPAVRVLKRGYRSKLSGWARPFSRFARSGMAKTGHIPPHEKLTQLRSLGAHLYVCAGSMEHFKVAPDELVYDDLPMVEYLTFMEVMAQSDVQLYM